MAETRNDKKRAILAYIEEKSEGGEILELQRETIIQEFSDENHPEEVVNEILDEVVDEERVSERTPEFDIIFPDKFRDKIDESVGEKDHWTLQKIFFSGYYVFCLVVLSSDVIPNIVDAEKATIIGISTFGLVLSFIFGLGVRKFSIWSESNIPRLSKHRTMISAITGVIAVGAVPVLIYSFIYAQNISPAIVAAVLPVSIAAGIQLGRYLDAKED